MNPFVLFALVLKASVFSMSGMGNVPSLHSDLVPQHWATERQFVEALAVGQLAPGPNGLWPVSLGFLIGGVRGSLFALAAILLPPLLVLLLDKLYRRVESHPAVEGFVRGLSLATIGVFVVVLLDLFRHGDTSFKSVVITLATVFLAMTRRVPIPGILALAAVAGVLWR